MRKRRGSINIIDLIKGQVKNWLLPYPFKIVGYVMLFADAGCAGRRYIL